MCTTGDSGEIIILSDDEDEEHDISCSEPSILIVEDLKKSDVVCPQSAVDEDLVDDLVVTFSRRAEVLPHARYDCPIHPFTPSHWELNAPLAINHLFCDQCFCYICDKLASLCPVWSHSGMCHCNSHKKSDLWNNVRNSSLLGGLKNFNLTLSEIDTHLRQADMMLESFKQELSSLLSSFMKGKTFQQNDLNLPNHQGLVHDYTPVYECVSSFLTKAENHDPRAAAIMRLGAAEEFLRHFQVPGSFVLQSPSANAGQAKVMLLQSVLASVQRQMVMGDFSPEFSLKLQEFYKKLFFPVELKNMRNSLCVRPWDDVLLVSVLKGQNVSGVRKDKGKKNVLIEQISVVLLRVELLQRQQRYRELCRYLRVIQTDNSKLWLQLQDLVPFFKSMDADLMSGVHSLFPSVNAPATRLTPLLFLFYLRVFETATAPRTTVTQPSHLCFCDAAWEPIKGAEPLKRAELVKFALRAQKYCSAVFVDAQCWTRLLTIVNTPRGPLTFLPAPNPEFLHEARVIVNSVVLKMDNSCIQIPHDFQEAYPYQSLLLLVTGALCWRILSAALSPALPVLNTFKENMWALQWLWDGLGLRLKSFIQQITQEIEHAPDLDHVITLILSSTANWDQQSSGC